MKIPKNRPAAASSYRGNPARMAVREKIRSTWLANPHFSAAAISEICDVPLTTAQESKPTAIRHVASIRHNPTRTAQDELTWKLYLEDKSILEIAETTERSVKTTKRAIASMKRDRLLKSLQTPNP